MGAVKNQILGYSPEQYYPLDTAWSGTTLTNLGSGGQQSWSSGATPPSLQPTSGPDGSGAWQFSWDGTNEVYVRDFQAAGGTEVIFDPEIIDVDYSIGVWFKIPTAVITGAHDPNMLLFQLGGELRVDGAIFNPANGTLNISDSTITSTTLTGIDDNQWHYYAMRVYFNGTDYTKERYIDGVLDVSASGLTDIDFLNYYQLGDNFVSGDPYTVPFEMAHLYVTPSATVGPSEIAAIWASGQPAPSVDINFSTTPATASALMTEPTIATTVGDNTYVTTSIIASVEFLPNVSVIAQKFINVTSHIIMEADVDLINNVSITTGTDVEVVVLEFTATADLAQPGFARGPLTAFATMGDHQYFEIDSYQKRVRDLNPFLYIYDGTANPVNDGYEPHTFTKTTYLATNTTPGAPLEYSAEGQSWQVQAGTGTSSTIRLRDAYLRADPVTPANSFTDIVASAAYPFSIEFWFKFDNDDYSNIVRIGCDPTNTTTTYQSLLNITANTTSGIGISSSSSTNSTPFSISSGAAIVPNVWYHCVVTGTPDGLGNTIFNAYVNGGVTIANYTGTFTPTIIHPSIVFGRVGGPAETGYDYYGEEFDEIALYPSVLSNSDIVDHFIYMQNLGPDFTFTAPALTASSTSGTHFFGVSTTTNYPATPATGSAEMLNAQAVLPDAYIVAVPFDASVDIVNPTSSVTSQINFAAIPATAYAEMGPGYFLDTTYSEYVISTHDPYRYVTFDGSDELLDYGSDADYSVIPTAIGGTIVLPGQGINNKSVLTNGQSYITDGVILKESEYDDDWGTGTATYHSSFWIKRSVLDQSTTGLRVIWNLNGALDNQHVVMYQYLGRLYAQFNNGSGTYIEQFAPNIDLFDYDRHLVAISFDHTGVNNFVYIYVDAVLVMTVDLGQYTGSTINSNTYLGPNDEANNFPRLSVGCLITPFADTSLPVVPTNTRVYIDEVVWAKSALTQTGALNLYSAMPGQTQAVVLSLAMEASAEFINPAVATNVNHVSVPMTAGAEIPEPSLYIVKENIFTTTAATAAAEMGDSQVSESITIAADVMIASAYTGEQRVANSISAAPMTADTEILNTNTMGIKITVNTYPVPVSFYDLSSPWVAYLRATTVDGIYPTREVS